MRVAAKADTNGQLLTSWGTTSHFNESEIWCRCLCGLKAMDVILIDLLETLRLRGNKPITVESGVRCPFHNAFVNGAARSQHLPDADGIGAAVDLSGPNPAELLVGLVAMDPPGLGAGPTKLHVDTRDGHGRWGYDAWSTITPELALQRALEGDLPGLMARGS